MSRAIGPPTPGLKSPFPLIRGGASSPRAWTSEPVKLSDANDSVVKPPKIVPAILLPPSRGMKLMRTPPVADCASTLETSMANSAMPVAFGTAPPPQPPPIIVLSATPLTIMRWSDCRLPLNSSDATSCTTEPPTSGTLAPPRLTPGINTPVVNGFRALGMAASTSWSITAWRVVLCTSTIGDLAGDRDGLFERADAHVGVDREDGRARQLHTIAFECRETREREGHRVGPGSQVGDGIPPVGIGGRCSDLLDQDRARRFDGDTRQHRTRAVLNQPRQRRLREGHGRSERQACQHQDSSQSSHTASFISNHALSRGPPHLEAAVAELD